MYTEYDGKMGYSIHNANQHVTEISREKERLKIIFADGSEKLVRQAMVVYTRDEQVEETTEEDGDD